SRSIASFQVEEQANVGDEVEDDCRRHCHEDRAAQAAPGRPGLRRKMGRTPHDPASAHALR
ncbi:MAG TPA: hypothetical protein VF951_17365, partial [Streptosporangiaceae bacterium]